MAKKVSKKPVAKKTPKKAAAPAKKPAKSAVKAKAPETKKAANSLVKTVAGAVGKIFGGAKDAAKPSPAKKKKEKKAKGKNEGLLEEDDLLASDEEIGSEEIPDLSEFDENETEEVDATVDDDLDEGLSESIVKPADSEEIFLTDAEGRRYCRVRDCDQVSAVEGYCRFHYLQLWKRIQVRRKILVDGKLERYVEELTARYPDKFLEMIRKDLRNEKDFLTAIAELEIDESAQDNEFEEESQDFINEVRGVTTDSGSMSDEEEF
jgi:hypothetical protein